MSMPNLRNGSQAVGAPAGIPDAVERPDQPIRAPRTGGAWLTMVVLRPGWLWRREWACVLIVAGAGLDGWLYGREWAGYAGFVAGAIPALVVLAIPALRRAVAASLRRGRLVRAWDAGCRFAGLTTTSDRVPRIVGPVAWHDFGSSFRVRIAKGGAAEDLEEAAERVAVVVRARRVKVTRDPDSARYALVTVQERDPFAGRGPDPWPWLNAPSGDFSGPIPMGRDELGEPVTIGMIARNLLVAGEPDAGKSVAQSQVLGAAGLDPGVRIWGWDAKQVELALWEPVLDRVVYNDLAAAIDQVRELIAIMDDRYAAIKKAGRRSATEEDGPIYLSVFDELSFFTASDDSKLSKEFNTLLRDLIQRGRAARMPVIAATQKPGSDVIPTNIRDLIGYRFGLRCNTRDASDTVLGAGMASAGFDASDIPMKPRGVGLLYAEGSMPRLIRSHYLSDSDIRAIAARGAALRAAA